MLFAFRVTFVVICYIMACILDCLCCSFSPRNPKHVVTFGHLFGRLSPVFGLKVELRKPAGVESYGNAIYVANHRNNHDMVTASNIVQSPAVTIGKKSLLWIPFFGQLYWLTDNLLIGRDNRTKTYGTIAKMINAFRKRKVSFWMFPEGTHSRGRSLLPFKTGTFRAATTAKVPIIPVCVSNASNKIKLDRWDSDLVIVEMLPPVDTGQFGKDNVRALAAHYRELMAARIAELGNGMAACEVAKKS